MTEPIFDYRDMLDTTPEKKKLEIGGLSKDKLTEHLIFFPKRKEDVFTYTQTLHWGFETETPEGVRKARPIACTLVREKKGDDWDIKVPCHICNVIDEKKVQISELNGKLNNLRNLIPALKKQGKESEAQELEIQKLALIQERQNLEKDWGVGGSGYIPGKPKDQKSPFSKNTKQFYIAKNPGGAWKIYRLPVSIKSQMNSTQLKVENSIPGALPVYSLTTMVDPSTKVPKYILELASVSDEFSRKSVMTYALTEDDLKEVALLPKIKSFADNGRISDSEMETVAGIMRGDQQYKGMDLTETVTSIFKRPERVEGAPPKPTPQPVFKPVPTIPVLTNSVSDSDDSGLTEDFDDSFIFQPPKTLKEEAADEISLMRTFLIGKGANQETIQRLSPEKIKMFAINQKYPNG
jgi:hypothetical protein